MFFLNELINSIAIYFIYLFIFNQDQLFKY